MGASVVDFMGGVNVFSRLLGQQLAVGTYHGTSIALSYSGI